LNFRLGSLTREDLGSNFLPDWFVSVIDVDRIILRPCNKFNSMSQPIQTTDTDIAPLRHFNAEHLEVLREALYISEDLTNDYFFLSSGHWTKNPFDVRTLKEVQSWEHPGSALAHLVRYGRRLAEKLSGRDSAQFYRICLHDHNILVRTGGGRKAVLLPFLLYVLTHELIHIARFGRFDCHPLSGDRQGEEKRVHRMTRDILVPIRVPGLDRVLDQFLNRPDTGRQDNLMISPGRDTPWPKYREGGFSYADL
jgi:hypothetical protein